MTWSDHSRRVLSVLVVAVCLVLLPAVAEARFTSSRSSGLVVRTVTLGTPSAVTGSYTCTEQSSETVSVTVTGFTDDEVRPPTYRYSLWRNDQPNQVATTTTTATNAKLSATLSRDASGDQWTLTIQPVLGSWTGPAYTRSISCPLHGRGGPTPL